MTLLFALLLAQAAQHPCLDDAKKLKPGERRIAQCLKQHKAELSPDCAARVP